jgi:hypothetical protein
MVSGSRKRPWRFVTPAGIPKEWGAKESSHDPVGWATAEEKISDTNTLWRQYTTLVDLYRYYIELAWKVSVWYYTFLGVSLAYFLSNLNAKSPGYLPLLLLFLSGMSGGLLAIFASSFRHLIEMGRWLEYIAVHLRLPGRPHIEFILAFFRLTCVILFLVALACLGLFAFIYLHA